MVYYHRYSVLPHLDRCSWSFMFKTLSVLGGWNGWSCWAGQGRMQTFLNRFWHSLTDLSYWQYWVPAVMLNLAHLGHRRPSTVSCCILPVTSPPARHGARPMRGRPAAVWTNESGARFKWPGRAVGELCTASYVCNVRCGAAATNYRERVTPPTSWTNNLNLRSGIAWNLLQPPRFPLYALNIVQCTCIALHGNGIILKI